MPAGTVTPGGPTNVSASTTIQTGTASPLASVTPTGKGALFQDLTNGRLYIAIGATNADWVQVGGIIDFAAAGTNIDSSGNVSVVARNTRSAELTDINGRANSGNNLGFSGQTVDGQQQLYLFLGPNGSLLHVWDLDGNYHAPGSLMTQLNAAPANADVSSSEAGLWFDPTNGAAKLMVKGKTANGTVVTASIALA